VFLRLTGETDAEAAVAASVPGRDAGRRRARRGRHRAGG
jgi:hypothetical protein